MRLQNGLTTCLIMISLCLISLTSTAQGALGTTSSARISITLVIPPRLEIEQQPAQLTTRPQPFCMVARGISKISMSIMPHRFPRPTPPGSAALVYEDGSRQPLPLHTELPSSLRHNTSRHCNNQTRLVTDSKTIHSPSDRPVTILLAPE